MHTPVQLAMLCASLWVSLGCFPMALGQQAQPLPPTIAAPSGDTDWVKPPEPARHIALVQYTPGRLLIDADNSSLNQILVEIAQQTGMKTTGGVADQRVFGTYGPGDPGAVLMRLLSGSGSNVLVREDQNHRPRELILRPSTGGPTPPSPASATAWQDRSEDRPQEPEARPHSAAPFPAPDFGSAGQPGAGLPATEPTGTESQPVEANGNPNSGTTTEQSPNGVKTPQQIYDQLLRMQNRNAPPAPQ